MCVRVYVHMCVCVRVYVHACVCVRLLIPMTISCLQLEIFYGHQTLSTVEENSQFGFSNTGRNSNAKFKLSIHF